MSVHPIYIHTSDRIAFKRCRRRWQWGSPLREGLVPVLGRVSSALWFGSGFHFALEDFHGYNKFGNLDDAFDHYVGRFKDDELPEDWKDLVKLARGMFAHYMNWRVNRDLFETVWVDDRPLVEVSFKLPLPEAAVGRPHVYYAGTLDRVVQDEYGDFWLVDYKTTGNFDTSKLEMDPQVSAYCWAARTMFDLPVQGMVFIQFKKSYPSPPKLLKTTGSFSFDKSQNTSYDLYNTALTALYGRDYDLCPTDLRNKYIDFLNFLLGQESEQGDRFIRYDLVRRNDSHISSVYDQIILETRDMIDSTIPIYPNPTSNCVWDCPFVTPCMAKDDGSDWEFLLDENYERQLERNPWRTAVMAGG